VDFGSIDQEAVVDTADETCGRLNNGGADSVFVDAINTMTEIFTPDGPIETVTPAQQAKVDAVSADLEDIAASANDDLKQLVVDSNDAFRDLQSNGYVATEVYVETTKAGMHTLLERCPPSAEQAAAVAGTAAPAATATATPTPKPTPKPTVKPKPKPAPVEKVTYEVESNGSIDLITYTHFIGGATAQEQASGPLYGKIQKNYTFKPAEMYQKYSFWSLGVSGMAGADATTITCRILLNGKVISQQTSTGAYANVMCNKGDSNM
jgi:hypothetical protein